MKKIFLFAFIFLAACSGQVPEVTVTRSAEVTAASPSTETPIPTPTLHLQFIALQDQIAAAGERFTLNPDGTVSDGEGVVAGITVTAEGKVTVTVDGVPTEVDPDKVHLDDENGISIDGFEDVNKDGEWGVAVPEAMQIATDLIEQYGFDPETVTVTELDGVVRVSDNETGKVMWDVDELGATRYGLEFAVDGIAAKSCDPTPFKPSRDGFILGEFGPAANKYMAELRSELNYELSRGGSAQYILINRADQCWGNLYNNKDLQYRDANKVGQTIRLIPPREKAISELNSRK